MFEFAVIGRSLLDLWRAVDGCGTPDCVDVRDRLLQIRSLVLLCRNRAALTLYETYLATFERVCGSLGGGLAVTATERADAAAGWPAPGDDLRARLIAMGEGAMPDQLAAFRELTLGLARLVDDPTLADLAETATAARDQTLRTDPSRADLWVVAANAARQAGDTPRARQILIRACASRFVERQAACAALSDLIAEAYRKRA